MRQCVRGVVPLLAEPSLNARQISQIRYGEFLDVYETRIDGMAWVQNRTDRYVGYIPADDILIDTISDLSHRVQALQTFVYPEPDVKSPPIDELTLGSFVQPMEGTGDYTRLASGGFVFTKHIVLADDGMENDYVFTAGRMLGRPYLWGGRTPKGLDCSGLVQLALEMAGFDCPRDSDQQHEAFGQPLIGHWRDVAWKRGDIVFFEPHHVGIMTGPDHIINANDHSMNVVVEPLMDIVSRYKGISAMGRP